MPTNPVDSLKESLDFTHAQLARALHFKSINTYFYHKNQLTSDILSRIKIIFGIDISEQAEKYLAELHLFLAEKARKAHAAPETGGPHV